MRNIKLVLEYDGSNYYGWQRLANNHHTIQGRLEYILEQITHEKIEVTGASRTDKDVHALGQVANFKTLCTLDINEIQSELNINLPPDIRVISAEPVPDRFHARYHAKMKEYVYQVWNSEHKNVFQRFYYYHIATPLDIPAMNRAKAFFLGRKAFKNFTAIKSKDKSTIKTIESIDIDKTGEKVTFTFRSEGFLHKMIRIITGTLLEVGLKEIPGEEVATMFDKPSRLTSGFTAPAHALFLKKIDY